MTRKSKVRLQGAAIFFTFTVTSVAFGRGLPERDGAVAPPADFREARAEYLIKGEAAFPAARMGHLLASPANLREYDARYYRLNLTIDEQQRTVSGDVTMVADSRVGSLTTVPLDFFDNMQVDSVVAAGQSVAFTHTDNILTVTLPNPVGPGGHFFVRVFYSGTPAQVGFGSFGFDSHQGTPIIWSLSEPEGARTWWPSNDDPSDKADSADVYLTVRDDLVATSNGALESTVDNGDGTKTYHWRERYPIATYLISVAISNYQSITDWYVTTGGDSMEVTHYVYPESYDDALVSFSTTVSMIEAFAAVFGEYPFLTEKYGHAEFPWGGAMEHQCNTSYGTWLITGDHYFDWIVAHELAHQWWGDMVTCETWPDIWLNEGFATYSEAIWVESQGGLSAYLDYMRSIDYYSSGGNFAGPVYDPNELFNETVYEKGGWVLHMLRHVLGDEAFFQALWDYGHDPELVYGAATTEEMQAVFEASSGVDLDWFFQEWVYGANRPHYEYWWQSQDAGGQFEGTVHIDQVQTNAPTFRMPLDIEILTGSGRETFTVVDSLDSQEFLFTVADAPTQVYIDPDGWVLKHVTQVQAGVGDGAGSGTPLPRAFSLHQNHPNPFNPSTVIAFDVPDDLRGEDLRLEIFDIRGRLVRVLLSGTAVPGRNEVAWDGRDGQGAALASGAYFYRLRIADRTEVRRMVLRK
jgi:aminopeptidase N